MKIIIKKSSHFHESENLNVNRCSSRILKMPPIIVLLNLISINSSFARQKVNWNGYIQTRFASDFEKFIEFAIRRAKLWIYGNVTKADFISCKIQMNYRFYKDEVLMLQDACADIRLKTFVKIHAGRFVHDFMPQRKQPDYKIPVLEHALVINSFIHNEKQMARETGLQYLFQNDTLPLHFSLGVFNANVDNPTQSKDNFLLYTSK